MIGTVPEARSVYGLGIHANVEIAALAGLAANRRSDVVFELEAELPVGDSDPADWTEYYASPERDAHGLHHIRVLRRSRPDLFRFEYADGTLIHVDHDGTHVWARGAEGASHEDTAIYLLGPTLGFVLQLRGVTCLHASVVAIGGVAVALVGPAGFGKSTAAAAFARRGHAVLADDIAALVDHGDRFSIRPAYPRIRLWPSSVEALFGAEDALPRIIPTWEKRFLALDDGNYRFQRDDLPLAAIYVLADRQQGRMPCIETMGPRSALIGLVANTFCGKLLDKPMRAREFEVLARLVDSVPVRRALPAAEFTRLDELCEAIERDV